MKRCDKFCKWIQDPECGAPRLGKRCKTYKLDLSMPRDIFLKLSAGYITEPQAWDLTEKRFREEGRIT